MDLQEATRVASVFRAMLGDSWDANGQAARALSACFPAYRFTRSNDDGATRIYVNEAGTPFSYHEKAYYSGPDKDPDLTAETIIADAPNAAFIAAEVMSADPKVEVPLQRRTNIWGKIWPF